MAILNIYWMRDYLCLLKETRPVFKGIVVKFSCYLHVFPYQVVKEQSMCFMPAYPKVNAFKDHWKRIIAAVLKWLEEYLKYYF